MSEDNTAGRSPQPEHWAPIEVGQVWHPRNVSDEFYTVLGVVPPAPGDPAIESYSRVQLAEGIVDPKTFPLNGNVLVIRVADLRGGYVFAPDPPEAHSPVAEGEPGWRDERHAVMADICRDAASHAASETVRDCFLEAATYFEVRDRSGGSQPGAAFRLTEADVKLFTGDLSDYDGDAEKAMEAVLALDTRMREWLAEPGVDVEVRDAARKARFGIGGGVEVIDSGQTLGLHIGFPVDSARKLLEFIDKTGDGVPPLPETMEPEVTELRDFLAQADAQAEQEGLEHYGEHQYDEVNLGDNPDEGEGQQ